MADEVAAKARRYRRRSRWRQRRRFRTLARM